MDERIRHSKSLLYSRKCRRSSDPVWDIRTPQQIFYGRTGRAVLTGCFESKDLRPFVVTVAHLVRDSDGQVYSGPDNALCIGEVVAAIEAIQVPQKSRVYTADLAIFLLHCDCCVNKTITIRGVAHQPLLYRGSGRQLPVGQQVWMLNQHGALISGVLRQHIDHLETSNGQVFDNVMEITNESGGSAIHESGDSGALIYIHSLDPGAAEVFAVAMVIAHLVYSDGRSSTCAMHLRAVLRLMVNDARFKGRLCRDNGFPGQPELEFALAKPRRGEEEEEGNKTAVSESAGGAECEGVATGAVANSLAR